MTTEDDRGSVMIARHALLLPIWPGSVMRDVNVICQSKYFVFRDCISQSAMKVYM